MTAFSQVDILEQETHYITQWRDNDSALKIHTPQYNAQNDGEDYPFHTYKKDFDSYSPHLDKKQQTYTLSSGDTTKITKADLRSKM